MAFFDRGIWRSFRSSTAVEKMVSDAKDYVFNSGYLSVADGHELYYEEWGNPSGVAVMAIHGGPGAAFDTTFKNLFDARKHRLILFDQRGSGKSRPTGTIENNRTSDVLDDIDRVRAAMNVSGRLNLAGGSWGSTLALLYAQRRPEVVKTLMIWSTFLATRKEIEGPLGLQPLDRRFPHPKSWKQFIRLIPREFRSDPRKIIEYALSVFNSMDAMKAWELAVAYTVYDYATCNSPVFNEEEVRQQAESDPAVVHATRIQMHYFVNSCFITENKIIDNIGKIRGIQATVVHGLDDWCTRPKASADLKKAYGENLTARYVKSGHLRSDPEMAAALKAVADQLS